jgi:hypothetical protein
MQRMSWFKLDDQFSTHPKVLRAGPDAAWLYICGGCYCAKHLTDGLIPKVAVPTLSTLRAHARLAQVLVREELWHDLGEDFEVHDYLVFNPSREHVENERRKAGERRAKGGRASPERRPTNINPDPTRPDVPNETSSGARKRGTRIPEEFAVTPDMVEWVELKCPTVNWRHHTQRFVNHFKAAPGQRGVKLDWVKTWENWMLKEQGA